MRRIAVIMAVVAAALPASASAAAPRPVLGRSVLLERVSGRVLLEQPGGTGFVRVTRPVLARIGANVDTTHGHARLTAAEDLRARRLTRGTFYGGRFLLSQLRRAGAYVALGLEGGDFAVCASAASTRSSAQVRQLWAKSSGRFLTVGRYSAASVRGTQWLVADRCDGTLTHSQRGLVDTTSIDGRIEKILRPGQTIVYFCDPVGPGTVSGPYCVVLWIHYRVHLRQYVIGDFYTMGLSSVTDRDHYDLCVTKPGEAESCSTYPLGAPDALGYRKAGVTCIAERPGVFVARWLIDGVQLGPAFAFRARRSAAVPNGCRAEAL